MIDDFFPFRYVPLADGRVACIDASECVVLLDLSLGEHAADETRTTWLVSRDHRPVRFAYVAPDAPGELVTWHCEQAGWRVHARWWDARWWDLDTARPRRIKRFRVGDWDDAVLKFAMKYLREPDGPMFMEERRDDGAPSDLFSDGVGYRVSEPWRNLLVDDIVRVGREWVVTVKGADAVLVDDAGNQAPLPCRGKLLELPYAHVACIAERSALAVWHVPRRALVAKVDVGAESLALAPDGRVAVGAANATVELWEGDWMPWVRRAAAVVAWWEGC